MIINLSLTIEEKINKHDSKSENVKECANELVK